MSARRPLTPTTRREYPRRSVLFNHSDIQLLVSRQKPTRDFRSGILTQDTIRSGKRPTPQKAAIHHWIQEACLCQFFIMEAELDQPSGNLPILTRHRKRSTAATQLLQGCEKC